jgi:hypothetical protein
MPLVLNSGFKVVVLTNEILLISAYDKVQDGMEIAVMAKEFQTSTWKQDTHVCAKCGRPVFVRQTVTPVIVGWLAGRRRKNTNTSYT